MYLTPEQLDDFVTTTLPKFKRYEWTDISLEHQEYVSSMLIEKKRVIEEGGSKISFQIQTKNTGKARNTGLYAQDRTGVEDVMKMGECAWTKQTTNWEYDVDEEGFQSDKETIVKILVVRDHAAMNDMAELNEENLWTAPTSTSDLRPFGIPFWAQKDPTTTPNGAFNGGNPSGFTSGCAGVDATVYPKWRNWTFGWDQPTRDDMVKKTKRAIRRTTFKAPVPHPELNYGKTDCQIFTTEYVQENLESLAEDRNDNLGNDVAKYMNTVVIAGIPVQWVPYVDANDDSNPLYGVNFKYFRPYLKSGANMRRSPIKVAAHQHTVRECHIDTWMNYICVNRRCGVWVGNQA
jgi:hypothetical protein